MSTQFATPTALVDFIRSSLESHRHQNGKVFYSGFETYLRGKAIFIGYNPGGTGDQSLETRLSRYPPGEFNHFLDERWRAKRQEWTLNTLQKRAAEFFKRLGLQMRTEVFTTNLYFAHTVTARQLSQPNFAPFKNACWPVVRHFLLAVPARVILCNSHQTFYELAGFIDPGAANQPQAFADAKQPISGKRQSLLLKDVTLEGKRLRLIGFPHLSRFQTAITESVRIKEWMETF